MAHPTSSGLMNACEDAIKKEKIDYQEGVPMWSWKVHSFLL